MGFRVYPGAKIAVVAPAGPADPESLAAGVKILSNRFRVVRPLDGLAARHPTLPYLVGSDSQRAAALNSALADPEVEAIFCSRGGYGSMRLLRHINHSVWLDRRIPIIGFSDCTALHLYATKLGIPSVHGPVVTQLARLPQADQTALFELLADAPARLDGLCTVSPGQARGPLVGGNLTLLTHLIGTPYMPNLHGAILLLEEVCEAPYAIDRKLTQLELCGVLDGLSGIVVGQLHRCDRSQGIPPIPLSTSDVIHERLANRGLPVATAAPVGHGARNVALPLGVPVVLDAAAGSLRVDEA